MAKSEKQKQKLFRIFEIFMRETDEEHGLTINEIISRLSDFGIKAERKSLYDDFLVLEEMGYPVSKIPTRPPKYKLDERIFELPELKMLVDAVQSSKFINGKKSREIISKLEIFAGKYRSGELSRQVYVEDRVKTENPATIYSIDAIHEAINDKKKLSFMYFFYDCNKQKIYRNSGTPYTVTPCALLWNDENYYLVALDEGERIIKNFRVDKMEKTRVLDAAAADSREVREFNPANYSKKIFGMYGGKEELVTLECSERLAGAMIDRFGMNLSFIKTDFGFKFSTRLMVSPQFYAWVLGFGAEIKLLSPNNVKEELVGKMQEILDNYKENK